MSEFTLDGYTFLYLPGPGGYSGYHPRRRRSEVRTLSSAVGLDWGIVEEDAVLTLEAPFTSQGEFLSVQERYQAEDAGGLPHRYTFEDPDRDYEVEIVSLEGRPYRGLYRDMRIGLKVLSAGS